MTTDEQATRVWTGLRSVLLDLEDRKREVSQALDMSFVRAKALRRLATSPLSMRALAQELSTDAPYTTIVVDDLERRGLVTRTVNPDDKRTKVVTATSAGLAVAATAQEILDRPPAALLSLPARDLATLDRIVAVLLKDLGVGSPT
jgi:DNA-binding MarR family transcriptional regulator